MNNWATALAILFTVTVSLALGEDFKTIRGKEYKDAVVTRVEPDGIILRTPSAIVKLYFSELPEELRRRFDGGGAKTTATAIRNKGLAKKSKPPKLAAAIEKFQRQGLLRIDCSEPAAKVWVAAKVWKGWDAEEKANVTKSLAAYCHPENPCVEIFDNQSGRKLASYGPLQRLEVY